MRRNILIILFCLVLPALVRAQELPLSHYTPDSENNPLPSADVSKVFQDRLGYLWMAIFTSGVVRYDGRQMDVYTTADGLKDLGVWEIIEDRAGRLWVGSNAGLVVSEKPLADYGPGERVRFASQLASVPLVQTIVEPNRLAVERDGTVWAGTSGDGIVCYRTNEEGGVRADTISTRIPGEDDNRPVRSILIRQDGSAVVGVRGGDLLFFEKGATEYELLSKDQGGPPSSVNVLYETPAAEVWGGCRSGLVWKLDEDKGRKIVEVNHDLDTNVPGLLQSSDNTMWVVSEGSGILNIDLADPSRRTRYTRRNGFLNDNAHQVMEDREGNIWFAQVGGVSKLRFNYKAFRNYTAKSHAGEPPVLPAPGVNAVLPVTAGELSGIWAGTSDGGVVGIRPDRVETIQTDHGLRNNWVNGLTVDEEGRLWIGTFSGINCLSLGAVSPPPPAPESKRIQLFGRRGVLAGYRRTTVFSAQTTRLPTGKRSQTTEALWFPAYHNLFCYVGGKWYVFRETSGLPVTSFHAVALDNTGRLWVGTEDHGLYRSTEPLTLERIDELEHEPVPYQLGGGKGTFAQKIMTPIFEEVWSVSNGAPTNQIEKLIWRENALWVGTQKGLFVIEGDPPRVSKGFTRSDGLTAENVSSMAFSPTTGSLWIGTNGGLTSIDPDAREIVGSVTKQNGLVDNEIWWLGSVAADDNGAIYFGTAKGLAVYDPALDRSNASVPPLRFRETRFTQDTRGHNELFIGYTALSFANERRVRYKTRLTGYDKDWSAVTADDKIRYTNLSAFLFSKEYVFEMMAANEDGVWSETPIQYTISVQPAWWFRWWAVLAQAMLLAGVGVGTHRVRTFKLKERARQLENTVQERTSEIRKQSKQLEKQNVELGEKNEQILRTQEQLIVQEKLASLGSLTAGIAHEIKNPLNFVNNFAELSVELVDELREDIDKHKDKLDEDTAQNIADILQDLEENVTRINEHGKRADGIVKGMLAHSGAETGRFEEIDVNALLEENFNLAFHSMRGQDASFNIKLEKDFDETIGKIKVMPQEVGRVFLNIIDNACRATRDKAKEAGNDYAPVLHLTTKNLGDKIEARVRDNGTGMPDEVREKVFNPFFTTRPTGEGTGLGMSISYDIIVQGHSGGLKIETEPGEYTEFIITLPKDAS